MFDFTDNKHSEIMAEGKAIKFPTSPNKFLKGSNLCKTRSESIKVGT